jgi:pyruvate kinase
LDTIINIEAVSSQLQGLVDRARALESGFANELASVRPEFAAGATNLIHYLALRQSDIRELQESLATLGLSSLGRAERNVMASLTAVQNALWHAPAAEQPAREALNLHNPRADMNKRAILGPCPDGRDVSIMVTLPQDAGSNAALVAEMISAGMNVARINCAHDDESVWTGMVRNVRAASADSGMPCRIVMDLAGPKVRTGDLLPGPRVYHVKPRRDPLGRTIAARRVRFIPDGEIWRGTKAAVIPVPRECIEYAHIDDLVRFRDTRGKKREFKVVDKDDKGLVLETCQGAYIATGMRLRLIRRAEGEKLEYRFGELPSVERPIRLQPGDTLVLHRDNRPGSPAVVDADGEVTEAAHISCRQPDVFEFVAVGDRVSLNDGKIGGVITMASADRLEAEIIKAKPTGSPLRGNRGVNFPDSDIRLPGLTSIDKQNLAFAHSHADAVALSFVRTPEDIRLLLDELRRLGDMDKGVMVKVENQKAVRNLPRLMLTAMRHFPAAVMIARGDLAVECGWERLAELQEEILWLCEAAQIPVVWATQVLEDKTKKGQPSRAEISDAALAQRADCVMLNKGPHIIAAIRMLDDILRRMQGHQYKKTARLRSLNLAQF